MNSSNLDLHELDAIIERAKEALKSTGLVRELEDLKVKYLGKKGEVTSILRTMGKLPADLRPAFGAAVNEAKRGFQACSIRRWRPCVPRSFRGSSKMSQ